MQWKLRQLEWTEKCPNQISICKTFHCKQENSEKVNIADIARNDTLVFVLWRWCWKAENCEDAASSQ